jgi:hypothetical protein
MSLRTNLSTRPFYNERAVNAIIGAVALVVAIATLANAWQLIALTTKDRALVGEVAANDTRARGLRQQVTQARSGLDGERLKSVGDSVREANAIIDGRTFSWTALLNWLETALPPDVRIVSIKPRVDTDGRFLLGFTVEAKTVGAIDTFIGRLEGTGRFDGLLVRQERETVDGTIEATAEGYYRRRDAVAAEAAQ